MVSGVEMYEVKWKGYGESTWEPKDNLVGADAILNAFIAKRDGIPISAVAKQQANKRSIGDSEDEFGMYANAAKAAAEDSSSESSSSSSSDSDSSDSSESENEEPAAPTPSKKSKSAKTPKSDKKSKGRGSKATPAPAPIADEPVSSSKTKIHQNGTSSKKSSKSKSAANSSVITIGGGSSGSQELVRYFIEVQIKPDDEAKLSEGLDALRKKKVFSRYKYFVKKV